MKLFKPLLISTLVVGIAGCATDDPNRRAKTGAGIGAVVGAVIGNSVSHARGAPIVGAVVGAIAGGAVGNYMDKQQRELEQQLAEEAQNNELQIVRLSDNSLKIGLASDVSFDIGSATLRPEALDTYGKIANILKSYDKTVIHVVGHTDTSGSSDFNQNLSVNRAASVGSYLGQSGVPQTRIREEGRGERELAVRTADNVKEARNRRVDIVLKPVVEGNEQAAWTPPPYLGG
ncbi:outer membrane protein OmpA-like peptidoglycan-associated protein [Panacagrimonas perspica]|uniref:Outer membrane protein OmpA-like peptidoglycan-associated protein n=1 Tax=Panacagrimonas perspica TaxID=381431 RepID=A0A4S3K0S8_9GAMM|nr:OmpA family protein [Panacagrimonas perspica]TDU22449.1 outer membrane protein OmpA-like peptidoglycan-associated protein [Panacagrimonas perspica]THD01418.1 flagellar motor protein MotB [Panacagrimonas perspica]